MTVPSRGLLVPTKLTSPQPLDTWIPRDRLVASLDAAADVRLVLVVAPAGFGKSTLAAQALLQRKPGGASPRPARPAAPVAWLALDEHDQDALRFLDYVAAAIERAVPRALGATREQLDARQPPPAYVVAQTLLAELSALAGGVTLALDDYHLVTASEVHQTVAYLLRHLPPACRVVLLSRADPPLPLTRLRAERQVVELRAADLRFTEDETGALLAHLGGAAPDAALVEALHRQTEGWAIALQLAAVTQPSLQTLGELPSMASRQIGEYLADEVFDQQPAELQRMLTVLAVPDRFCAELYAALVDPPEDVVRAERAIEELTRANLFVIPLDQEGGWFRFHHLFRDLLLRRLHLTAHAEGVRALRRRAARWLAGAGLVEEAVHLFLAARDEDAAAELVERQLLAEIEAGGSNTLTVAWLRRLPDDLIARRPGLALCAVRRASLSLDLPALEAGLARVDALLAARDGCGQALPWPTFVADHTAMRAILHCWQGRADAALAGLQAALAQGTTLLPAGQLMLFLGLASAGAGRSAAEAGELELAGAGAAAEYRRSTTRAGMHLIGAELEALEHTGRRLAEATRALGLGDAAGSFGDYCLGVAAYERSDLDRAAAHFGAILRLKYRVNYTTSMSGVVGMLRIALARGALADAAGYVEEAWAIAQEAGGDFLRHQSQACRASLALAQGDVPAALRAVAGIAADIHLGLSPWLEPPRLCHARALIAAGTPAQLEQADAILTGCLAEIEPLHNVRLLIVALALRSLVRHGQGRPAEAAAALERALALAAPRGVVRPFVDLGPALHPLLRALAQGRAAPAFAQRILALAAAPAPVAALPSPTASQPLFAERLTRREVEVLALLAERWSNQEIADQLVVTVNTVRKHTSTIYDKLGVASRREAVTTARALGILPKR